MTAYTDHKSHDYEGEKRKRQTAKRLGIASIVIGVGVVIIYIIIIAKGISDSLEVARQQKEQNDYYNG